MMKDALGKWLEKQGVEVGLNTARSICDSLGLDSEKKDACLGLVYRFEKGEVDEPEFMQGLLLLSGKSPEELSDSLARLVGKGKREGVNKEEILRRFPVFGDKLLAIMKDTPERVVWIDRVGWAVLGKVNDGVIIPYMEVAIDERGKGLGTKLMRDVIKKAGALGATFIEVGGITPENERFFQRLGFEKPFRQPLHGTEANVLQKRL